MTDMNKTWMGQTLNVVGSTDSTLIGRTGLVVDESQHTVTILLFDLRHFVLASLASPKLSQSRRTLRLRLRLRRVVLVHGTATERPTKF